MKNKIVLSSSEFNSLKVAEEKINEWWHTGSLANKEVKAYKVIEEYKLKLRFEKTK